MPEGSSDRSARRIHAVSSLPPISIPRLTFGEIKNAKPPHWQSRERIGLLRADDREHRIGEMLRPDDQLPRRGLLPAGATP